MKIDSSDQCSHICVFLFGSALCQRSPCLLIHPYSNIDAIAFILTVRFQILSSSVLVYEMMGFCHMKLGTYSHFAFICCTCSSSCYDMFAALSIFLSFHLLSILVKCHCLSNYWAVRTIRSNL